MSLGTILLIILILLLIGALPTWGTAGGGGMVLPVSSVWFLSSYLYLCFSVDCRQRIWPEPPPKRRASVLTAVPA